MATSLEQAIHLVSGEPAAGCVKQVRRRAGATEGRIHLSQDLLTIGPCDVDPQRHLELRRAFHADGWRRPFGLGDLRAAIEGDSPVVLWGTRAFADLVWLWWALDGLGRIGADPRRLWLARPRPGHPLAAVGGSTPDEGQAALAAATPIGKPELKEGAELWQSYASPSPLEFDQARRRGSSVFPELVESGELHGAWFPRLENHRLRLSELDELLLGRIGDTWRTIYKLLGRIAGRERLLWPFGDFVVDRLRAWATHGAVAREERGSDNPYEDVYRMTGRTQVVLAQGLESVGDAPRLHVGGCLVNDPRSPWVRIGDESDWRLGLLGG